MQHDDEVWRAIVDTLANALDELCGACMDEKGQPIALDRKALMKARAMLPQKFDRALKKG